MVSAIDLAKRKLVALLKTSAGVYHVALSAARKFAAFKGVCKEVVLKGGAAFRQ